MTAELGSRLGDEEYLDAYSSLVQTLTQFLNDTSPQHQTPRKFRGRYLSWRSKRGALPTISLSEFLAAIQFAQQESGPEYFQNTVGYLDTVSKMEILETLVAGALELQKNGVNGKD